MNKLVKIRKNQNQYLKINNNKINKNKLLQKVKYLGKIIIKKFLNFNIKNNRNDNNYCIKHNKVIR